MSSDPAWDDVKTWFARALDEPADRRVTWLASQSLDAAVRERVVRLLAAHDQAGTFLQTPVLDAATVAATMPQADVTGQAMGAYRLLRELGRGGMGIVYLAERADGLFDKQVAIKVVAGPLDASLRERFESERRVLATLEHPHIARLLDGGTTPGGAPYLVMELVDGTPIDAYCRDHALDIAGRLRLFAQVCAAVRYAHQHFVVHRDLKPNNVLVTSDGTVKLLDFGIAKVLDPTRLVDETIQGPLTPTYASPEQLTGGTVTTASDVYSLGVILYRLLAERSPYPADSNTPALLARAIAEYEVSPPSVVTGHRALRGDLDAIVLRAMEKDPRRRYESIEPLAEDVRRYLSGLPVSARRPSWTYRSQKFIRRHRVGVAAGALVVIAVAGGVIATVRQARIADRQRRLAEKRFDDVRELSNSLIFDVHDAIQNLPGSTPARQLLLDRAVTYLDTVARDADDDVDLQRELARGYQRLATVQGSPSQSNVGDTTAAIASARKSAALFEAVARARPGVPIDRLNEAMGRRVLSSYLQGDPSGRQELDRAMAITDDLLKSGRIPQVLSERSLELQNLGFQLDIEGDRASAAAAHEQGLALLRELADRFPDYPRVRERVATTSSVLAYAFFYSGQRAKALELAESSLKAYTADQAAPSTLALQAQRNLALTFIRNADFQLAEGDIAGARERLAEARHRLTPLAAADRTNQMLQLDMVALDYMEGRLSVVSGQPQAGLASLQRAVAALAPLKAIQTGPSDIPDRERFIDLWTAEAEVALGHPVLARAALMRAIDAQASAASTSANERASLAGNRIALARLSVLSGPLKASAAIDASARDAALALVQQALRTIEGDLDEPRQNLPAVYPAVEAHLLMADLWTRTGGTGATTRTRDCVAANESYTRARALAARIGPPARISPLGLPVHIPPTLPPSADVCAAWPVTR